MSDSDTESSSLQGEQQEEWDEWEEDESQGVKSLLSDAVLPSVKAALAHDKILGFDLLAYMQQERLGQYDVIKLVNFFRSEAAAGRDPLPALAGGSRPWDADAYFQPVLPDDELLFHDWEAAEEEAEGGGGGETAGLLGGAASVGEAAAPLAALQRENEALRSALEAMQAVLLQDEGGGGLAELLRQQQLGEGEQPEGAGPSTSVAAAAAETAAKGKAAGEGLSEADRIDASYFESYSFFDIHREMLGDKVRTDAYQAALEGNPSLLSGATVLDVGCGTGILSMFAARGGAAAVVGVDGSEEIAKYARANCAANGLGGESGKVTVVSGRVEALTSLPLPEAAAGKVDVLVSEWMGYALLFESMLDSVLHARDRFLRPGGAILPDLANIYVAAGNKASTGLEFWASVYGFNMAAIQDSIRQSALQRAVVRPVSGEQLVSASVKVKCLDLATMRPEEQDFTAEFRLEPRPGAAGPQACHSLVMWFDTVFSERFCRERPVTLTTSPDAPQTHWVQTVLLLREPVALVPGGRGTEAVALEGCISLARNKGRHRSVDIALKYSFVRADGSRGQEQAGIYSMGVSES